MIVKALKRFELHKTIDKAKVFEVSKKLGLELIKEKKVVEITGVDVLQFRRGKEVLPPVVQKKVDNKVDKNNEKK